jgi:hypothetical protein
MRRAQAALDMEELHLERLPPAPPKPPPQAYAGADIHDRPQLLHRPRNTKGVGHRILFAP